MLYTLVCKEDLVVTPGSVAVVSLEVPFKLKKHQVAIATLKPIPAHVGIQLLCPMYFISKGAAELSVVLVNNAEYTYKIKGGDTSIVHAIILDTYAGTLL